MLTRLDRLYGFLDAVTASVTVDPDLDSVFALASLAQSAAGVDDARMSFTVMSWDEAPPIPTRSWPRMRPRGSSIGSAWTN